MLRFAPPFRGRYIASTRGGVTENIARVGVSVLTTCAAIVAHEGSATVSTSIRVSASGQQTDQQHYGTATVGVVISSTASASVISTHSGTATASIVITTTAAGETGATHAGTANIGVTISATASGTASQTHAGVASCQVNLSASASGFNTSTTVPDETSNGNNMSLYADGSGTKYAYSTDAVIGTRSVEFEGSATTDGTGGYGIIDNTFQSVFRSSFSVSAWVKLDDGDATYNWILGNYESGGDGGNDNRIALYFQGGDPAFYYKSGTVAKLAWDLDYDLANGQSGWIHLVGTYNATDDNMYLYVNGTEVASDTTSIDPTQYTNSVNLRVNKYEDSNANYIYTGKKIDDISIWSKALSSTEVSNLYNSGSGTSLTGSSDLEGWWKMGDHSVLPVTHSGTATVSVAVTASADGTASTAHSGTASCQVNLSASASGSAFTAFTNNYSIDLDGSDDQIDADNFNPNTQIGTGAFTMSMWMKTDSTSNQIFWYMGDGGTNNMMRMNYLASSGGFKIWATSGGTWTNQYPHVNISTLTDKWYHVAVVRSGTTVTLYVNGTNSDSATHASLGTGFGNGSAHWLGRYWDGSARLDGHIDEYALWDEALTSSEIEAIYNSGAPFDLTSDSGNYASSANLIGYWRFEDNTVSGSGGYITDSSTNSNTLQLFNGPTFSTDVPVAYTNEYSLDFDGTNDYLSTNLVTNTYSLKDGFSASLWVKLDDVSTTQDFFGRYGASTGRFYFGITGSNVRAAIGTSFDTSTLSHGMSTGTWYHVAYTFSGGSSGTFTYYLNGSSVGTISFTWTSDSGSYEPMHIGGLKNGSNLYQNPTNGKLDEFALYNSTLSASDITAIYNSGAPADQSYDSNLVAYWRMEENTGTTVADSSSNSNTATLNNGPTFSTDVPS